MANPDFRDDSILGRLRDIYTNISGLLTGIVLAAGTARIGTVSGVLVDTAVEQVIDGSLGAYAAGDVVGADDCCTTTAVMWEFEMARENGGSGVIFKALLENETENQEVQYTFQLFNATVTGELRDNFNDTNPIKADIGKLVGVIEFPYSVARGATVMTTALATPNTSGNLPLAYKCAAGTTKLYGVLRTNTIYTQEPGDKIRITLSQEQY